MATFLCVSSANGSYFKCMNIHECYRKHHQSCLLAKSDICAYWLNCDVVHSFMCIKCIEYLCYLQGDWLICIHTVRCVQSLFIVITSVL